MTILSSQLSGMSYVNAMETILFNEIDWEQSEVMDNWEDYGFVCKDVLGGEIFKVSNLESVDNNSFSLACAGGISIVCNLKKEKRFFEINGESFKDVKEFSNWLKSDMAREWFSINEVHVQCINIDNGAARGSLLDAHIDYQKQEFFKEIKNPQKVYKAHIIDKNLGGFIALINGVNVFLPGSLAAANKIVNFDSFIGKNVYVMLEDYLKDGDTFIVSHKKYIQKILPERISQLKPDITYQGEITGTSKFGIFIEFDGIFTGLLHISEMDEITKSRFKESKYFAGDTIQFYIKEIAKDNRIILSEFPPSVDNFTIEEFKEQFEGSVIDGEITSAKPYGYFVRFLVKESAFTGLLYIKDVEDKNLRVGSITPCFIEQVDLENKKIYLKTDFNN